MRVCRSEDDRNGFSFREPAEAVHNIGETSRADARKLEWLKRCVEFQRFCLDCAPIQKIYEVKPSLVDQKVEFGTPAKQMHKVWNNTVEDLSESTRSVAKKFILVKF